MDINDLFDGIMKSINQFADEIAEQRLQEKNAGQRLGAQRTNGARAAGESRRDATAKQGTIQTRSGEWG